MSFASTILLADAWGMHGDVGTGWTIVMMAAMVLFWAAIILGIAWVARGAFGGWRGGRRETATEILERRFAEGAISVEDYHRRREVIASAPPEHPGDK